MRPAPDKQVTRGALENDPLFFLIMSHAEFKSLLWRVDSLNAKLGGAGDGVWGECELTAAYRSHLCLKHSISHSCSDLSAMQVQGRFKPLYPGEAGGLASHGLVQTSNSS